MYAVVPTLLRSWVSSDGFTQEHSLPAWLSLIHPSCCGLQGPLNAALVTGVHLEVKVFLLT